MTVLLEIGGVREASNQCSNFISPLSVDPRAASISSILHVCILIGRGSNVVQVMLCRGLREGGSRLSCVDFYREGLPGGGILVFKLGWRAYVNNAALDGVPDILHLRRIFSEYLRLKLMNLRVLRDSLVLIVSLLEF